MWNVALITKTLTIIAAVFAVVMLGLTWASKNKKAAKKIVISILLIVLVVVNGVVYMFNNVINQHFSMVQVDDVAVEDAEGMSKDITTRIEEEGIVLLKNEDNALPMTSDKVNLFGIASTSLTYGGAGSGASDETENVTLEEGLKESGIEVNEDLTKFYEDFKGEKASQNVFNLKGGDYNMKEPAVKEYSDKLIKDAKAFSETAIVVFSRNGGEGGDLPIDMGDYEGGDAGKHYLELQDSEKDMLALVEQNFDQVIVLINSSNAMELGFLEDEAVDAALWIGGPGATGCIAVGEVLKGTVNPSGRLVDTYAYDLTSSPAYQNCGDYEYTVNGEETDEHYVEYAEGIYVGYRYYETRFINNQTGECDEDAYKQLVQYPFGYGLSYTTFEQTIKDHFEEDGVLSVTVEVTNTGDVAGKDVVQVYATAPYTQGGIEKAFVELEGFGKTSLLEPGKSEEVTVTFDEEDLAAYDADNHQCYVLESGDYEIKLMKNAHELIDSYTVNVASDVVYDSENKRTSDQVSATNAFDFAKGDITYVSRSDWEGTLPKERVTQKETTQEFIDSLNPENVEKLYVNPSNEGEAIATGENNGLTLADMSGLSYDDETWDQLLAQLSVEDMAKLVGFGGFSTVAIDSVGKVATIDVDGPAGLHALTSDISGVQFPSEVVIGSTFNTELVKEMGQIYANEAYAKGVVGLYAPGLNIHRTPFSGRNFEYYSEDPVLNGKLGAALTLGCNEMGVYCYPKHFALNDQETNRSGVCVWSNEQAIREIYLKAFEIVVKEGNNLGLMSSYNRIGGVWAGGCDALLTTVLRDEWGFVGCVATDYANTKMMNADQSLLAGGSIMLSTTGAQVSEKVTGSVEGQQQLQRAAKNVLYMVANSRAYVEPVQMGTPYWLLLLIGLDVVIALLILIQQFYKKKDKSEK
ncbi:MAG: glycoside hydrolase family 3 C-terminal domain-containing protein [Lachnospiraceae bacterium]|nr:glycoside hydrolase family 3 C-terminal domain-containing protein [Lachnospiraceae bacterium]